MIRVSLGLHKNKSITYKMIDSIVRSDPDFTTMILVDGQDPITRQTIGRRIVPKMPVLYVAHAG